MGAERQQGLLNRLAGAAGSPEDVPGRFSQRRLQIVIIGGIVMAEVIAMVVVYFFNFLPYYQQVILDTIVMTVITVPILYFLSFRPLILHIQQRYQTENITQARLGLMQFANAHTLDELLQNTLDEIQALTNSTIGYFHFLEADQKTIALQAWSTNTLQNLCRAPKAKSHYSVDVAGVWADCIRQRRPVIHNDYAALPHRKGLPPGHAPVVREMAVPIIRDDKIVAILGMGNKPRGFSAHDVELVTTLADFAWDIVQHKRADIALHKSEEKFRTLVDWTFDWEEWLDPQGRIVYTSPACERITGYRPEEFSADPGLLARIVHADDCLLFDDHQQLIHDENAGVANVEYRILARDGSERWIEHLCRPLFDADQRYLGRRVSCRDITERKRSEADIRERNRKEKALTQTIHTMQIDIARDLHDTIGQNVSFMRMKLDHLSETRLNDLPPNMQTEIAAMTKVANETYDLVRGTLSVLQAQNSADLFYLFKRYARQVAERSLFEIAFENRGEPRALTSHQMRQLFFIFREALNNVEKHAEASRVFVELAWGETDLTLCVRDNGHGFDAVRTQPYDGHYGLKFMRERAALLNGSFSIQSEIGAGTQITVAVTYEPQ